MPTGYTTERLRDFADSCAGWLVRLQRPDGSWPLFIDPRDASEGPFDFIRSAVAAHGLAIFARATDDGVVNHAARKAFLFLCEKLPQDTAGLSSEMILLRGAYLGNLAHVLNEKAYAEQRLKELLDTILEAPLNPLLLSQTLLLAHCLPHDEGNAEHVSTIEARLGEACLKAARAENISLALWIEPLRGLLGTPMESAGLLLADRIAALQSADGSFPNSARGSATSAYTRGTAKILEILALKPKRYAHMIERALPWLASMQYAPDTGRVASGFRHDHVGGQAWIDANGHLLIGLASLLQTATRPSAHNETDEALVAPPSTSPPALTREKITLWKILSAFLMPPSRFELPQLSPRRLASLLGTESELPTYWQMVGLALREAGILDTLQLMPAPAGDPIQAYAIAHGQWDADSDGNKPGLNIGHGLSTESQDEALSIAVGECLERMPFAYYRQTDLVHASIADLRKDARAFLDPEQVAYFSEAQRERFPDRNFDDRSIFSWVEGHELGSGAPALIPAQLVYWNYNRKYSGRVEPCLRESSSHGGGGYFTRERALLAGIYEWIQRDGFFVHWLGGHAPNRIHVADTGDAELVAILKKLDQAGIEPTFLDITTDVGVPATACILIDRRPGYPAVTVGAGCGPDPIHTLRRAALEACSIHHWIQRADPAGQLHTEYVVPFVDQKLTSFARILRWGQHDMISRIAPFLSGDFMSLEQFETKKKVFADDAAELREVLQMLRALGEDFKVYAYESTHPALGMVGFQAIKTFIPGLFPLYYTESNAPIAHPRLKNAARALGFEPPEKPFPTPHPFP